MRRTPVLSSMLALAGLLVLAACGDDSGPDDAAADAAADATGDSGATDARVDSAPSDTSVDAPIVDSAMDAAPPAETLGIWLNAEEIAALPTTGDGWDELEAIATGGWGSADVSDQDNGHDVATFAGALYAVRMSDDAMRAQVVTAIEEAIGTEAGGRTLALGRQLLAYVLAADLIGYREDAFVTWVSGVRTTTLDGRAGIDNLLDSATQDPSNWGCHARASMIAAARYLGDDAQLAMLAERFHDYLGRTGTGFTYRELWWQADPSAPVGINPVGATISGQNVDGVIPDDQRRGGMFEWPPPRENYVWESLQGSVAAAHMLERAGHDAFAWEDRALLRAVTWLHDEPVFPAEGDDSWVPFRINAAYSSTFPTDQSRPTGKSVGFTGWTHP